MLAASRLKMAKIPPRISTKLKPMIIGISQTMPLPPRDQALEYIATILMRIVTKKMRIRSPHSNVLVVK